MPKKQPTDSQMFLPNLELLRKEIAIADERARILRQMLRLSMKISSHFADNPIRSLATQINS